LARHRVGDSYLSDEEYAEHLDWWVRAVFFLLGAVPATIAVYWGAQYLEFPKAIQFMLIVVTPMMAGCALAYLRNIIIWAILVGTFCWGMGYLGVTLWENLD